MLAKRVFDVVAALAGLLLLAPVLLVVAILVKLDSPGPAFFLQERVGQHGRIFRIIKFRTMRMNSEGARQITVAADSRITRVGAVLRRFKLDELPQLINVVRGDMSLVGPRPEVPRFVACYPAPVRAMVLSVRPGITDWASIEFKDENAMLAGSGDPERRYTEEILPIKLQYYMRYVRERSFGTDLRIIFSTLRALVS